MLQGFWSSLVSGGGGGSVNSVNGVFGANVLIDFVNFPARNANTLAYFDATGKLEDLVNYTVNSIGGLDISSLIEPDALSGGFNLNSSNTQIDPLQNSPDETWNVQTYFASIDPNLTGFSFGSNNQALNMISLSISHVGTSDTGSINHFNTYMNIGNGTDPIDVRGISLIYGFGNVHDGVNLSGPVQGYGFQYNFDATVTQGGGSYTNAFYDFAQWNGPTNNYTSFASGPNIDEINNNNNYTGINLNPNIDTFTGNAGCFGINVGGNLGTFGTGGAYGININQNVTSVDNYNAIYASTQNVTALSSKWAGYFDGDVNITGNLTFGGALSIGTLNAFGTLDPIIDGGGNPTSVNSLISQVFSDAGTTVANGDTIGINTALLLTMRANSIVTSGALGLGVAALALPAVIETHTGSSLDFLNGAVFALNFVGSSTGGTIGQGAGGRFIAIPNGITTVNRYYGVWSQNPFGSVSANEWGIYIEDSANNYIEGSLAIGGAPTTEDTVVDPQIAFQIRSKKPMMKAQLTTTERNALTPIEGMEIYNLTNNAPEYYNGTVWV